MVVCGGGGGGGGGGWDVCIYGNYKFGFDNKWD